MKKRQNRGSIFDVHGFPVVPEQLRIGYIENRTGKGIFYDVYCDEDDKNYMILVIKDETDCPIQRFIIEKDYFGILNILSTSSKPTFIVTGYLPAGPCNVVDLVITC
jgi:hypothetical protein